MILGILQARLSSTRLPGKVLELIEGKPMLACQIERLKRARRMDAIVVATSDVPEDAAVAALAMAEGVHAFQGSLDDVLERMAAAAAPFNPTHVVRLTGDCPLADWEVIDQCIDVCVAGDFDYCSNTLQPTWPDGIDVEVVRHDVLQTARREATTIVEREHVTPFVNRRPERFRLHNLASPVDLSTLRWTVDEPNDLAFIRRVYAALYPTKPAFNTADVLALMHRHPDLALINAGIERNKGLQRTIARWKERSAHE